MSTISKFSWTRLEGLGIILTALGIALLSQLPPTYFAFMLLNYNFDLYSLAMIGTILGTTIVITTIACSLTEDWDEERFPSLRNTINTTLIIVTIFLFGFFLFFILQPNFPVELRELDPNQRYLSAYTTGLTLVFALTIAFYKLRNYFK